MRRRRDDPDLWTKLRKTRDTWRSIRNVGRRVLVWLFVALFIVFEWNLLPAEWLLKPGLPQQIALSLLVLLAASLVELLIDTRNSVEQVSEEVDSLVADSDIRTYGLHETARELAEHLETLRNDEHIIMEHLGLNLEQSWDYLRDYFLEMPNLKHVTLRLLMLPSSSADIKMHPRHPVPNDIKIWCKSTGQRIAQIDQFLRSEQDKLMQKGRELRVTIKQYRTVPVVHGYSVAIGDSKLYYVSFCRWRPSGSEPQHWPYDWGENCYHRITSGTSEKAIRDLASIFDGHFQYLWQSSGSPVLDFPGERG